jgi:hypothetical protein
MQYTKFDNSLNTTIFNALHVLFNIFTVMLSRI